MRTNPSPRTYPLFLLFTVVFSLQIIPRIGWYSLTADEPTDITNGYYYLTRGDVVMPHNHPPLASTIQSLPLLFMNLKTQSSLGDVLDRAHYFLFDWNLDKLEAITRSTRLVSWVLGLAIGFLIFWNFRKESAWLGFALFLWALDPLLSTLSGLAKTDIAPTLFFFWAVLAFQKAQKFITPAMSLAAGVLTAMAVTCKFYGLVLIPIFLTLEILNEKERFKPKENWKTFSIILKRWCWGTLGFFLFVFLIYLPGTLCLPEHRSPLAYFFSKLGEDIAYASHPYPVYFLGQAGLQSHWYYLPVAFILKEPIPFLFLLALGLFLAVRGKIIFPAWLWVPPLFFTLAILPTLNLGVRYLLPAIPFLFLIGGKAGAWMWQSTQDKRRRTWRLAVIGLMMWQAVSVLTQFPRSLSYFNDGVKEERKIGLLGDSNLDWGQDLKCLAGTAKARGWKKVRLAYLGAVDPEVYGLDWEPLTQQDLLAPQPGMVYAINAGFFQLAPVSYPPTRAIAEGWIGRSIPTGKVGDTWYYFEIPGEPGKKVKSPFLFSAPFQQYRGYRTFGIEAKS